MRLMSGGTATIRAGLAIGAVAAVLAAIAPSAVLAEGPSRAIEGATRTLDPGAVVGGLGVGAAVLLGAAAVAPWLWARLAGTALATAVAATSGLIVITGRTSDDFAPDADITLRAGGILLTASFWIGLVGVAVALVGFRRLALAPAAEGVGEPRGPRRAAGKATTALVLGIAGFIVPVASPLAVAVATLALGDIRAAEGRLEGRGLALTGMILGIVALCLLAALVGVGTLAARPGS